MGRSEVLSTKGLGLVIGGATILADVTLAVYEGEFVAIIGPNGAGKTSLFNLLSGLYKATSGSIELDGRDISALPPFRRAELGLGRTFQISSLFSNLSTFENVRLAAEASLGGTHRIWRRATKAHDAIERAKRSIDRVRLTPRQHAVAGSLSHGDKRKLEIAMLLASDPRVILLDEPMAGVSAEEVDELVDLIGAVQKEDNKTIVMVEHHMEIVIGLAGRIAVMHHGALLAYDTPTKVMANSTVQSAYLGDERPLA